MTLTGCATTPQTVDLIPMSGSKADGTVKLSASYNSAWMIKPPSINKDKAIADAGNICKKWGYSKAEAFGGSQTNCIASNQYGCMRQSVTVTFQCD